MQHCKPMKHLLLSITVPLLAEIRLFSFFSAYDYWLPSSQ